MSLDAVTRSAPLPRRPLPSRRVRWSPALALCLAVSLAGCGESNLPAKPVAPAQDPYEPLATAYASRGRVSNYEAAIPPMCYTKTAGTSNPCWTCHVDSAPPNQMHDEGLQEEYAFSEVGLENHWKNLFRDRRADIDAVPDEEILRWIRTDNYAPLRAALSSATDYPGYRPDLDFEQGFDAQGFANDGSGWRALRYQPFLGTFWPTNGSTDDVFIRLAPSFRREASGRESRDVYRLNLAILEAAVGSNPTRRDDAVDRTVDSIDESVAGIDLDGNGSIGGLVNRIRALPARFVGGASAVAVERNMYPRGVEFLHSVRYVDPDAPTLISRRMKELRYSTKDEILDPWARGRAYEKELNEKEEGRVPVYRGGVDVGLGNAFGWRFQGFIEDRAGRLRLQTEEEHRFCMGCHSTIGVTVDSTFAFPRKVPGDGGWRWQDVRGLVDRPQAGHKEPEVLEYFRRVGGGDEFRANTEILAKFFPGGVLADAEVRRAATGGDRDLTHLVAPSRERALRLNKAYRAVVFEQSFTQGRDAVLAPATNVHERIEGNGETELGKTHKLFNDGRLWLDWDVPGTR